MLVPLEGTSSNLKNGFGWNTTFHFRAGRIFLKALELLTAHVSVSALKNFGCWQVRDGCNSCVACELEAPGRKAQNGTPILADTPAMIVDLFVLPGLSDLLLPNNAPRTWQG